MRQPTLLVIFLTVFIDLIGFGIVLPLLPIYTRAFGMEFPPALRGLIMGAVLSSFSFMQFLFAPGWGRLSDRVGRRPVLLVSIAGSALSYAVFALGSNFTGLAALGVVFASRVLAGVCGANITVAQAYIADITPPEQRSRRMGLIGMAFGLGFIFGPALGGVSLKHFGQAGPGWVAASLCAANLLLAVFVLPESWKPAADHAPQRPRLGQWFHTLAQPKVGLLIAVYFLATFCFSCFETTLGLLVSDNFHLDIRHDDRSVAAVTYLFAYCGIIGVLVQGGAIGRLVKKCGEARLIALSLVLLALGLAPVPFIHGASALSWKLLLRPEGVPWLELFVALALLSIGSSLTRPPLFGLISMLTSAHEQGATIGVAQSAGSLARILGPIFASLLYHFHPSAVYLSCSLIALLTAGWTWQTLCKAPPAVVAGEAQPVAR
jgi:MFS family permease